MEKYAGNVWLYFITHELNSNCLILCLLTSTNYSQSPFCHVRHGTIATKPQGRGLEYTQHVTRIRNCSHTKIAVLANITFRVKNSCILATKQAILYAPNLQQRCGWISKCEIWCNFCQLMWYIFVWTVTYVYGYQHKVTSMKA